MANLDELLNQVDELLNDDSPIVDPKAVEIARKLQMVIERVKPEINRAERAGLDVNTTSTRLNDTERKLRDFLNVYDR